jgi:5,10-methylene-tetrahydrofolate dehydrogenase/methenyl tetrahydrofolate cyclohydrolase
MTKSIIDKSVHGILIQLPLPSHIDEITVIDSVLPLKDVDGLHSSNLAQLASNVPSRTYKSLLSIPFHLSCTAQVIEVSQSEYLGFYNSFEYMYRDVLSCSIDLVSKLKEKMQLSLDDLTS